MSEPFLGEIKIVGFNFPPRGWTFCDGQILNISQHTALFSLLGTTFGGDGRSTFGLPELRSRFPRHVGSGPGLDTVTWGEKSGHYQQTLTTAQMPSHNHNVQTKCNSGNTGLTDEPTDGYPANGGGNIYSTTDDGEKMAPSQCDNTGSNQAFNIMNPFLGLYFCIALEGLYPSRS